jgi:hypothetical protein
MVPMLSLTFNSPSFFCLHVYIYPMRHITHIYFSFCSFIYTLLITFPFDCHLSLWLMNSLLPRDATANYLLFTSVVGCPREHEVMIEPSISTHSHLLLSFSSTMTPPCRQTRARSRSDTWYFGSRWTDTLAIRRPWSVFRSQNKWSFLFYPEVYMISDCFGVIGAMSSRTSEPRHSSRPLSLFWWIDWMCCGLCARDNLVLLDTWGIHISSFILV